MVQLVLDDVGARFANVIRYVSFCQVMNLPTSSFAQHMFQEHLHERLAQHGSAALFFFFVPGIFPSLRPKIGIDPPNFASTDFW